MSTRFILIPSNSIYKMVVSWSDWWSSLCACLSCTKRSKPSDSNVYLSEIPLIALQPQTDPIIVYKPAEKGMVWITTIVKRRKMGEYQRLYRKTQIGTRGDVSRFFKVINYNEAIEGLFSDTYYTLITSLLPDRFREPELVGAGGQGIVLSVKDERFEEKVALKHVYFGNRKFVSMVRICREIQIGKFCDHPNICKLYEVFSPEDVDALSYVIFLFEEVHTTLSEVLHPPDKEPTIRPSHRTASEWLFQILSAVNYLHERNIIHRDLKPSNIGLTLTRDPPKSEFKENHCNLIKVLDMGMARSVEGDRPLTPELGTYSYMAPELLLSNHVDFSGSKTTKNNKPKSRPIGLFENTTGFNDYDNSIDIWAIGVMFAEILQPTEGKFFKIIDLYTNLQGGEGMKNTLKDQPGEMLRTIAKTVPICETDEYNEFIGEENANYLIGVKNAIHYPTPIRERLRSNLLPEDDDNIDTLNGRVAIDLLQKMLRWNPRERITAREALNHPYFLHLATPALQEIETVPENQKYIENLPSTMFNDKTMISELDEDLVHEWRERIFQEIPWIRGGNPDEFEEPCYSKNSEESREVIGNPDESCSRDVLENPDED